jgi:broad specificity phosphatase PhoE
MTLLYLVRHGVAAAGIEDLDPGLSDIGNAQASVAAQALAASGARRLVVSPLRRTRETAAPIATALGLAPEIREEVSEVFDPSLTVPERQTMLGAFLGGLWSEQAPELKRWRERVIAALLSLSGEPTIVVSHFVAICAAIGAASGSDRVAPVPVANASITRLAIQDGALTLLEAGSTTHLAADDVTNPLGGLFGLRNSAQAAKKPG